MAAPFRIRHSLAHREARHWAWGYAKIWHLDKFSEEVQKVLSAKLPAHVTLFSQALLPKTVRVPHCFTPVRGKPVIPITAEACELETL